MAQLVSSLGGAQDHHHGSSSLPSSALPPPPAKSLSAEEYLRQYGVDAIVNGAIAAVLTQRPTQPLSFMTRYFEELAEEPSPLLRTYRAIVAFGPPSRDQMEAFTDMLASTYVMHHSMPVTHAEMGVLLEALGIDCPPDHVALLKAALKEEGRVRQADRVTFSKYSTFIKAAVAYKECLCSLRAWWKAMGLRGDEKAVDVQLLLDHATSAAAGTPPEKAPGRTRTGEPNMQAEMPREVAVRLRDALRDRVFGHGGGSRRRPTHSNSSISMDLLQVGSLVLEYILAASGRAVE